MASRPVTTKARSTSKGRPETMTGDGKGMFNGFKPTRQNLSPRISPTQANKFGSSFKPRRTLKPAPQPVTDKIWHPKNTIIQSSPNQNWLGRPQPLPTRCREETLRRSRARKKAGGMPMNQNDLRMQMKTPLVTDRTSRKKSTAVPVDF